MDNTASLKNSKLSELTDLTYPCELEVKHKIFVLGSMSLYQLFWNCQCFNDFGIMI